MHKVEFELRARNSRVGIPRGQDRPVTSDTADSLSSAPVAQLTKSKLTGVDDAEAVDSGVLPTELIVCRLFTD